MNNFDSTIKNSAMSHKTSGLILLLAFFTMGVFGQGHYEDYEPDDKVDGSRIPVSIEPKQFEEPAPFTGAGCADE